MNNSSHIFRELTKLLPELNERHKPKDVFYIGLRLEDKQVPKVEVFLEELLPVLFQIIDTNQRTDLATDLMHPIWLQKEYRGVNLLSVFVCDATSQTVYDSRYYQSTNQKYKLQKDKDPRLLQFKRMEETDKEQVVDLTIAQIMQMQDDYDKGTEASDTGPDNSWGEMPWDFQE